MRYQVNSFSVKVDTLHLIFRCLSNVRLMCCPSNHAIHILFEDRRHTFSSLAHTRTEQKPVLLTQSSFPLPSPNLYIKPAMWRMIPSSQHADHANKLPGLATYDQLSGTLKYRQKKTPWAESVPRKVESLQSLS